MSKEEEKFNDDFVICGPSNDEGEHKAIRINAKGVSIGSITQGNHKNEHLDFERIETEHVSNLNNNISLMKVVSSSRGPAKVNNEKFRSGWDNIFGSKKQIAQA